MAGRRRLAAPVLALACCAALIAGCAAATDTASVIASPGGVNNSAQSPAAELTAAAAALGNGRALTTTLKLGTTDALLGPILHSLGATLTPAQVADLAGLQVTLEAVAPHGTTISDLGSAADAASFSLTVSSGATTYLAIRHVDQTLYAQADVKDLLAAVGQSSRYAALEAKASSLPSFVQALLDGKWVSLPDATLSLLRSLGSGGLGASPAPSPSVSPSVSPAKILGELQNLLAHDVKVTRLGTGRVDRLALTASPQGLASGLIGRFGAARGFVLPRRARVTIGEAPRQMPSRAVPQTVTVSADVVQGALSELSLNLGQYAPRTHVDLPLELLIARSGVAITAPSGAVAVDAIGLLSLASLLGGHGAGSGLLGGLSGLSGMGGMGSQGGLSGISGFGGMSSH